MEDTNQQNYIRWKNKDQYYIREIKNIKINLLAQISYSQNIMGKLEKYLSKRQKQLQNVWLFWMKQILIQNNQITQKQTKQIQTRNIICICINCYCNIVVSISYCGSVNPYSLAIFLSALYFQFILFLIKKFSLLPFKLIKQIIIYIFSIHKFENKQINCLRQIQKLLKKTPFFNFHIFLDNIVQLMDRRSKKVKLPIKQTCSQKRTKKIKKQQKSSQKKRARSQINQFDQELKVFPSVQKRKQNILSSLYKQFNESTYNPQNIVQWNYSFKQLIDKVFGNYYIIMGPKQSGKLSLVRYAISKQQEQILQIFIDCFILTTEYQIYKKILDTIKENNLRQIKKFFKTQQKYDKILQHQNLNFTQLYQFVTVHQIKFVIIIKNAEHLVSFPKQYVLYNLFQWMKTTAINTKCGLFLLTNKLMLTDLFEKRVKSRFQGTKICLFRPQKAEDYLKIISKRIDTVKEFKSLDQNNNQIKINNKFNQQMKNQIYYEEQQIQMMPQNKKKRIQKQNIFQKQNEKKQKQNINKIQQELCSLDNRKFLIKILQKQLTIQQLQQIKILITVPQQMHQQTIINLNQREYCLNKLKTSIINNSNLHHFIQSQMINLTIVSIPFILKTFQMIFMIINETLVKQTNELLLKKVIFTLFKNSIKNIFPFQVKQYSMIQQLNSIEKMLLLNILKMHKDNDYPIFLRKLCGQSQSNLHRQIYKSSKNTISHHKMIIKNAWNSLRQSRIIYFNPSRIWDYPIRLLSPVNNFYKAFYKIYSDGNHNLSQYSIERLRQLNLLPKTTSYQKVHLHYTVYQDDS